MTGETDLGVMLQTMSPVLNADEFVFCSFPGSHYGDHSNLSPVAAVAEPEGLTLVLPRSQADEHGLSYDAVFKCITLMVHSSLEAVGLTAAVSTCLASAGISANMIAGFYHDHVYVDEADALQAMQVLGDMAAES